MSFLINIKTLTSSVPKDYKFILKLTKAHSTVGGVQKKTWTFEYNLSKQGSGTGDVPNTLIIGGNELRIGFELEDLTTFEHGTSTAWIRDYCCSSVGAIVPIDPTGSDIETPFPKGTGEVKFRTVVKRNELVNIGLILQIDDNDGQGPYLILCDPQVGNVPPRPGQPLWTAMLV